MPRITVNVTEEDIQAGQPCNCWRCPIALAINRVLGWDAGKVGDNIRYNNVKVDEFDVSIYLSRVPPEDPRLEKDEYVADWVEIPLPDVAIHFIDDLDYTSLGQTVASVSPFSFELEVPECV